MVKLEKYKANHNSKNTEEIEEKAKEFLHQVSYFRLIKGFGYSLFSGESVYTSTISARYWKDGSEILIDQSDKSRNPRVLTPVEAGRLQGYRILGNGWEHPECANNVNYNNSNIEFKIVVSKKEAYRQFGNSVAIPVIKCLAKEIVKQLM